MIFFPIALASCLHFLFQDHYTAFHKNVLGGIGDCRKKRSNNGLFFCDRYVQPTTFKSTVGAENDKNFIYGAAFVGTGTLFGGTLVGGKRTIVRLKA